MCTDRTAPSPRTVSLVLVLCLTILWLIKRIMRCWIAVLKAKKEDGKEGSRSCIEYFPLGRSVIS